MHATPGMTLAVLGRVDDDVFELTLNGGAGFVLPGPLHRAMITANGLIDERFPGADFVWSDRHVDENGLPVSWDAIAESDVAEAWEVRCNATAHTFGPFTDRAEAERWAEWSHACLVGVHEIRPIHDCAAGHYAAGEYHTHNCGG